MKYFTATQYTPDSLKKQYRELCLKLHPDKGGDAAQFIEMKKEYAAKLISMNNSSPGTKNNAGYNIYGDYDLDALINLLEEKLNQHPEFNKLLSIVKILLK